MHRLRWKTRFSPVILSAVEGPHTSLRHHKLEEEFARRSPLISEKLPESPLLDLSDAGSFDCVVVRFAHDNFAQDDNVGGAEKRVFGET